MTQPSFTSSVRAPSNIALIKYWGKSDTQSQWPANDSFSMTLSQAHTVCKATLKPGIDPEVTLGGSLITAKDHPKIFAHIARLMKEFQSPEGYGLSIETNNSFPMGCGIASSASGFAALTLATWEVIRQATKASPRPLEELAHWARLGSGSAGRSLFGGFVGWNRGASADSQVLFQAFPKSHWALGDTIAIFSDRPKHISSTKAHESAWSSPLFPPRLAGIGDKLNLLKTAISNRNIDALGRIIEQEALEMHGVMMSSEPPAFYFDQEVSHFLGWLRRWRQNNGIPAYFTMDAGPNVHIISPLEHQEAVAEAIAKDFDVRIFKDQIGSGPSNLDNDEVQFQHA